MNNLEQIIYDKVKKRIDGWCDDIIKDIYVLSFYIDCELDDMRKPRLTLGYNTNSNLTFNISQATDECEAKWNYAFWLQNEEIVIGENNEGTNKEELQLRDQWVGESQWFYTDTDEEEAFDRTLELGERIVEDFYEIIKNVVKRLHNEGVIIGKFNKALPLIIHELEYYERFIEINQDINPEDCIREFVMWIDSM